MYHGWVSAQMDIIEHVTTYKLDTLHYYGAKFWAGAKPRARDPRLYALTTIASSTASASEGRTVGGTAMVEARATTARVGGDGVEGGIGGVGVRRCRRPASASASQSLRGPRRHGRTTTRPPRHY